MRSVSRWHAVFKGPPGPAPRRRWSLALVCQLALLVQLTIACSEPDQAPAASPDPTGSNPLSPPAKPIASLHAAASALPSAAGSPALDAGPQAIDQAALPADAPLTLLAEGGVRPAAQAERFLHVGDSMVPLVGNYLRPLVQGRGGKYFIDSVTSSSTLSWDNERRLQQAMYRYDPQVVLISLGSNELFDRTPERRAPAIQRLVADTRGRPCLWIGPPAWKKDFGFIEVLKSNLGHCRYLDSTALKLPRMEDGRHPSWSGSHRWATVTWQLLGGVEPVPTGSARP